MKLTKSFRLVIVYLLWGLWCILQKPCFLLFHKNLFKEINFTDFWQVMYHGLPLDLSIAGYLSIMPGILILIEIWYQGRIIKWLHKGYNALASAIYAITLCLNLVLYHYWDFPLDSTPLYYFFSSPASAFASVSVLMVIGGVIVTTLIAIGVYLSMQYIARIFDRIAERRKKRISQTLLQIVLLALLILPIRGGIKTSTMNTGEAYFSKDMHLNHAAVNPMFSLMESLSKQVDFASQYRFMSEEDATKIVKPLLYTKSDSILQLITVKRPDVYIIILESFSQELMKTQTVPYMNQYAKEGVFFNHFYANSFRTDRGTLAILSGYPAQPTTSLMKFPRKTSHLPSIAEALSHHGYGLKYYYGGDINFTNLKSYLTGMGFIDHVSDVDFPLKDRLSKWGVPDHLVFEKVRNDLQEKPGKPMFRVIQTSSSHEPFDVDFHKLNDKVLNAFAYTDYHLGRFIDYLKHSERWERSLIILIPDHLGGYPAGISEFKLERYHIPMIWLGGAVKAPYIVENYGSQQDLAATLLGQLKISHNKFTFSKDMLDYKAPHFAFFTFPDLWGMATQSQQMIYDNVSGKIMLNQGCHSHSSMELQGKAYLQELYNDIARR